MKRTKGLKRSPLKRGTKPLQRSGLARGRSQRSAKSGGHLFYREVDDNYRAYVRTKPCLLYDHFRWATGREWEIAPQSVIAHRCTGFVECAHVKSRGSSGADHRNCVPLCSAAHHEQHAIGIRAFQDRWGVDLKAEAAALWNRYQSEVGAAPRRGESPR